MIASERINSQLSLLHAKAITFLDLGGGGGGRLTIILERINSQLSLSWSKAIIC